MSRLCSSTAKNSQNPLCQKSAISEISIISVKIEVDGLRCSHKWKHGRAYLVWCPLHMPSYYNAANDQFRQWYVTLGRKKRGRPAGQYSWECIVSQLTITIVTTDHALCIITGTLSTPYACWYKNKMLSLTTQSRYAFRNSVHIFRKKITVILFSS